MKRYKEVIGSATKDLVDRYVSSLEFDRYIVKHVVAVMLAHVKELARKGVITGDSANKVIKELVNIFKNNGENLYKWISHKGIEFEDVFEALEAYLHEAIGRDAGKIPIGRSRNDHIALALRLAIREHLIQVLRALIDLRKILVEKAIKYGDVLFPFFTHEQLAQCGSASLYFLTYEQVFSDIFKAILSSLDYLGQNTMGSGASTGSYLSLDLKYLSKLLCLSEEPLPPYYATGSRLFLIHSIMALSMLMAEISRFAEDIMLLNNIVPRGIKVPSHHISTSSIMPHKRNLVSLEIARAKASKAIGILSFIMATYKSVPYGYNLDFQEINRELFELMTDVEDTLSMIMDFIENLELDGEYIYEYLKDKPCWSSDLIEYIAIETDIPIRDLYAELAMALRRLWENNDDSLLKSFLRSHGIGIDDVWKIIRTKPIERGLDNLIEFSKRRLKKDMADIEKLAHALHQCIEMLINPST
ncbi:MAG: lyase family protein [Desulfurococcaceae archaeon]